MKHFNIPKPLSELNEIFVKNNFHLYLVGGAVRDYLLGLKNNDYDFTTDATPEEVSMMFPHSTIPTGIKHGTVTVIFKKELYEITTFRSEGDYLDSRHPSSVEFVRDLSTDLERRDFTINALAVDLTTGEIIDYHNGIEDLNAKVIRAIGEPKQRFDEDGLRLLRACRFAAKLDFKIEENTFKAIVETRENIRPVSVERIKDELFSLLLSHHPKTGLEALRETGLLDIILPEFVPMVGMEQKGMHKYDVWNHTLACTEASVNLKFPQFVTLASFFHDIGKTVTYKEIDGVATFYNHEVEGERLTKQILKRLKASNEEIYTISHLVREHMFHYTPDWRDGAVRRFINRIGLNYIPMLFQLRICDQIGITGEADTTLIDELQKRIDKILAENCALKLSDLNINGKDLMTLSVKGKLIGLTLNYILEQVIDDPSLNEKDKLLKLASLYIENHSSKPNA